MSVEAISWALNLAPVPRNPSGKRNPACKAVLIGLANHAAPDGMAAFPAVRTLVRYTDLSERTVRTALDRLAAEGIIQPCDPAIVAAKIKRADQRPQGWDLAMHLVQPPHERGAAVAPEPSFEPSREPPAAEAGACEAGRINPDSQPAVGGGEFFTRLGPGWPLTGAQRRRLAPMVAAALDLGWDPAALATFVSANTAGVRSPAAVLAARLSPAELPAPVGRIRARPAWCGACSEQTRRLQRADGADAGRCPRCHPLAAGGTRGEAGQATETVLPGLDRGQCSPWVMPDQHHSQLTSIRLLAEPVPCTGRLGVRPTPAGAAATRSTSYRD